MSARDVVITGIGLVSSLGEGTDAHWRKLSTPGIEPVIDETRYAPYVVHPLPEIDWSLQIAKRGDQRQMENWQRLGTYAAGLALDDAGMKGDEALCATMDMIVAAGGGERDEAVDQAILEASATRNDRDVLLNEKLTTELRPTLFLAQLSNLLAGNISIVHKVTGSSRTFMGEEGAGISAVETAAARIRSGQSTHALVGGAFQTEHPDMLLGLRAWPLPSSRPVEAGLAAQWCGRRRCRYRLRRGVPGAGIAPACRKARMPYLRHDGGSGVSTEQPRRWRDWRAASPNLSARQALSSGRLLASSGVSGAHAATAAESAALAQAGDFAVRGISTLTGHLKEAQFPFAIALAALAIKQRRRLSALRSRPRARVRRRARGCARHRGRLSLFRGHGARQRRLEEGPWQ